MMSKEQKRRLINDMFSAVYPLLMDSRCLIKLPSDEISCEDDIQKVLDGEDEEGSNAREYYGNWSEEDLLDEQAILQLGIIEECFETFMERVK